MVDSDDCRRSELPATPPLACLPYVAVTFQRTNAPDDASKFCADRHRHTHILANSPTNIPCADR